MSVCRSVFVWALDYFAGVIAVIDEKFRTVDERFQRNEPDDAIVLIDVEVAVGVFGVIAEADIAHRHEGVTTVKISLAFLQIENVALQSFQRRGIGSKLLQYCIEVMKSKNSFLGLLLEIQLEDVNDSDERKIRKDRIRFYKKFGAKTFENVEYYIPPQSGNIAEKLHLMIIPFNELDDFSKKSVENIVRKMHLEIYDSKRMDLIEKTVQSLSDTIKLI